MERGELAKLNKERSQYQGKLGQIAAKAIFEKIADLTLKKLPERKGQETPDYEFVDRNGVVVAVGEVKTLTDTITEESFSEGGHVSLDSDRRNRGRLKGAFEKAKSQVGNHDCPVKVIVFVCFDGTDYIDLAETLKLYKEAYPDEWLPDWVVLAQVSEPISGSGTCEVNSTMRAFHLSQNGKDFGERFFVTPDAHLQPDKLFPIRFTVEVKGR